MNDPKREEPLVGLEHVVEIRFEGRKEPHYECRLCGFHTEMAPMIEHLSGYKHRRAYISKEFPDKMKRKTTDVKECKVSFLRRIAGELEKTEGLKMYKIEGYVRPSTSSPAKKKARWEDDCKRENDPVRKQKALEFLETFHITSDSEATLIVRITQELTEALKAFCEKKAATGSPASGIREWLRLFSQSASGGNSAGGASSYETSPVSEYSAEGRGGSRWNEDSRWNQDLRWSEDSRWNLDSRCQGFRHQKSGYKSDWSSHQYSFSSSGSYRSYQQFRSSDKMSDEDAVGLTPNVVNRVQGKDTPTMTRMLKQLAPYYPALQKINIQTLVNVLVETRGKD
ncbi:PREDICTED: uncharacterized protein LOC103776016 [Merops nubicus]|uniref:uncharacterized protein LOC103776016 n=1 Tax=Merops nubicus TaxID=57421 RepID=UPI0004F026E7|nr:PREDICTED: uncharacterized protein LOC103776016 [Merops nubicus]